MTVGEWVEKLDLIKDDKEFYIKQGTALSIARYCTKCADSGNRCETCKISEFAVFCGINEPLNKEEALTK
jgi:hypothetical protein